MMYGIVHKNKVIVGPMNWSQKYFTNVLKIRYKIEANLPGTEPENLPYIIDENTSLHKVVEIKPEINHNLQYYYGPIWDISNDIIVANYEIKEIPVNDVKINIKSILAGERYKKEIEGTTLNLQNTNLTLDTSRESRSIFIQKYMLMSSDETINWKFSECWLTITKLELETVIKKITDHVQSVFDWEKEINDQIDSCLSVEELLNIDFVNSVIKV